MHGPAKGARQAAPNTRRDRFALLLALLTVTCLAAVFLVSTDRQVLQFLMPGPLASVHGAIENCSACHAKSGGGKLSWLYGLSAGDRLADSKACLTCHKMSDRAFNAHGASPEVLKRSTERLTRTAAETPAPHSARAQSVAFPTHDMVAGGIACATCHKEHQGVHFKLNKISNEQCRSCHLVKFDSFDGHHPKFVDYPFKRRTRIVYDHAGHFDKHFPEIAKKDPDRNIPDSCATCHTSRAYRRLMEVAPFSQTCASCHLDQIVGKERVSGPKGVAFLTLPGLDLQTLKEKGALIGEWPDMSDAELTPFMKVMIGRNERGRALIKTVDSLNLQNLSDASEGQIEAVTNLVWEIKGLFHALIAGKASDVLANMDVGGGAKLSPTLVADLTASIPRDVVISAQQQWLPNLGMEMGNPQAKGGQEQDSWRMAVTLAEAAPPDEPSESEEDIAGSSQTVSNNPPSMAKLDPPPCTMRVLGQCLLSKPREDESAKLKAVEPEIAAEDTDNASAEPGDEEETTGSVVLAAENAQQDTQPEAAAEETGSAKSDDDEEAPPLEKTADQTDDLLFPTEAELREIEAAGKAARSGIGESDSAETESTAVVMSIGSDVDPESWAEHGGWYRQDYAIFYRPTGHKDRFIYAWLMLTGPKASRGDTSPAAAVFDFLTNKEAQGSCTKCHSVDDLPGKGRAVNFSPPSVETKRGSFTRFTHEPHFQAVGIGQSIGIVENHGCLTCHSLEQGGSYLKSYDHGDPQDFVSNFGTMKKDLCQTCHTSSTARQDCLVCHKYHVNGVITPIMDTRIPTHR